MSKKDASFQLQAQAWCKIGAFREVGTGELVLTEHLLKWTRRRGALDALLFWIPQRVEIRRDCIVNIQLHEDWTRAWITLEAHNTKYAFRIGTGPYPKLEDNKDVTRNWYEALFGQTSE
jgi:hypothetical protein